MTSVLRSAPWRRAPVLFLKQPAVALVVGTTALILGVSAAAAPLYLASVGSASVSLQMAQRCVSSLGDVAVGSGPLSGVGQAQGSLEALSAARARIIRRSELGAHWAVTHDGGRRRGHVEQLVEEEQRSRLSSPRPPGVSRIFKCFQAMVAPASGYRTTMPLCCESVRAAPCFSISTIPMLPPCGTYLDSCARRWDLPPTGGDHASAVLVLTIQCVRAA